MKIAKVRSDAQFFASNPTTVVSDVNARFVDTVVL